MARKRIGLALSGGAAKGLAHIGVVKAFLELRVPIDCVAGTSAGSIVGAMVAAAVSPDRMIELAKATRWRDVVRPVIPRRGLLDSNRMEQFLETHLGALAIEDLALPYAAVACDLETGRQVVLTSGRLARAVRASCAVPGFFNPVEIDGRLLVDGGVCNNVPCDVPRTLGADLVVAVDLSGSLGRPRRLRKNIFSVILRSFEIMQQEMRAVERLRADVVIRPRVDGLSVVDLHSVAEFVKVGYDAAMAQKETLADLMEKARGKTVFHYVNPLNWFRRTRTASLRPEGRAVVSEEDSTGTSP